MFQETLISLLSNLQELLLSWNPLNVQDKHNKWECLASLVLEELQ